MNPVERTLAALSAVGAAAFLVGVVVDPRGVWPAYLVASHLVLSLGLGGFVLVAIFYVTKTGWGVALRRVPEAMASAATTGAVLTLLLPLGAHHLYEWTHPGVFPEGSAFAGKRFWFDLPFWSGRQVATLAIWIWLGGRLLSASRDQDADGSLAHSRAGIRRAAGFLVVFAFTYNLAAFDWFMSLEPHWYSTVYGVYHFSGLLLSAIAAAAVCTILLRRAGPLAHFVNENHLHDLGRLLFAFSSFWAYIWFCQYMLIWYTNIPEETAHFAARFHGSWEAVFWLNPILSWAVPFACLLPRAAKRNEANLLRIAIVVLVGRWLDLFLCVHPVFAASPTIGIWSLALTAGAIGAFGLSFRRGFRGANAVPIRDPLLDESLRFHT